MILRSFWNSHKLAPKLITCSSSIPLQLKKILRPEIPYFYPRNAAINFSNFTVFGTRTPRLTSDAPSIGHLEIISIFSFKLSHYASNTKAILFNLLSPKKNSERWKFNFFSFKETFYSRGIINCSKGIFAKNLSLIRF